MSPLTRRVRGWTGDAILDVGPFSRCATRVTQNTAVVGTIGVRAMIAAFTALGLDSARLATEAGIDPHVLSDPDGVLPSAQLYRLWEIADREWGRPALGIRAAGEVPVGAYEVLDYLMFSSQTVGAGLSLLADYLDMATRTARYELHVDDDVAACEMVWRIPPQGIMFHLRDYSLSLVASRVAFASDRRPLRVELAGLAFATAAEYAEAFGVPTVLDSARNALIFSRDAWETPLPRRDDVLNRTLRRHAQFLVDRQPPAAAATVTDRVRTELLARSQIGLASIEDVARELAMSVRTLQRRLRLEGVSFEEIASDVHAKLAKSYLVDSGVSISEVSYLLGFSEPSAFSRAFRKWTGMTPQDFRRAENRG